jgi:hypothetical protein
MRETKLIRLRTALYRLAEGLLLLAGTAGLMRLAMEQQSALQKSVTDPTANMWAIGILITLGMLAFFAGFIATIQALQWLFAVIFRGPFIVSSPETDKV